MEDRAEQRPSSGGGMLTVLAAQAGIGVVCAILFWGLKGTVAGYSALLGSLTCVLPNAFLALRLALPATDAKDVLRAAWIGELGKLGITIVMFVLIFAAVRPLDVLPLFTGFIAAQLMVFTALLDRSNRTTEDIDGR